MPEGGVHIRPARASDLEAWVALRTALWPAPAPEHRSEVCGFFATGEIAGMVHGVMFAEASSGALVGFAEVSESAVAGAELGRRAHLEGWFVSAAWRGRGVGKALIEACGVWACGRGHRELTSDTDAEHAAFSVPAHLACGFVADAAPASIPGAEPVAHPEEGRITFRMNL